MSKKSSARAASAPAHQGLVVATHGRHVLVESPDGERRICHPRGKKNLAVVGDVVDWLPSEDEGTVERVAPRRNLFYRQDEIRTKSFAANLDQVLILLAAEPEFSERQLARALISAEASGIRPLIVLNKSDLASRFAPAWDRLAPYRAMGYDVLPLCLRPDGEIRTPAAATGFPEELDALKALENKLAGHVTLVLGPSGAGKSSLINHWIPAALAQTNIISKALNSGKHTTTSTSWYWLGADRKGALIDSPGFQEFGLHHIEPGQLANLMPDLRSHLGQCRFYNCTHLHEPGCGVINAIKNNDLAQPISDGRYQIYTELYEELSQPPNW